MHPNRANSKVLFMLICYSCILGLLMPEGQDHISWCLWGSVSIPITVEDEDINLRLNTSGTNWELEFDDNESDIFIKQNNKIILQGCFLVEDGFAIWEKDILNMDEYTIIEASPEENPEVYFCSVDDGNYLYLKKIENSRFSVLFFTPEDTDNPREKIEDAFQRLTISVTA